MFQRTRCRLREVQCAETGEPDRRSDSGQARCDNGAVMSDSQSTTNRSDNGDQDNPRLTARRSPQPETPREFYPEGERHDRLFQIARLLLSQGLTIATKLSPVRPFATGSDGFPSDRT